MADENRVAGILYIDLDGTQLDVIGDFTININGKKRETLSGSNKRHGYKEMIKEVFIEGEIRDSQNLDMEAIYNVTNSTIRAQLANGKDIVLRNAFYAGDGDLGTEEANLQVRFEGMSGEVV